MATTLKNSQQGGAMAAKEERARDAALAMQEYKAAKLATNIKTARLRALRLAKESERKESTRIDPEGRNLLSGVKAARVNVASGQS